MRNFSFRNNPVGLQSVLKYVFYKYKLRLSRDLKEQLILQCVQGSAPGFGSSTQRFYLKFLKFTDLSDNSYISTHPAIHTTHMRTSNLFEANPLICSLLVAIKRPKNLFCLHISSDSLSNLL